MGLGGAGRVKQGGVGRGLFQGPGLAWFSNVLRLHLDLVFLKVKF